MPTARCSRSEELREHVRWLRDVAALLRRLSVTAPVAYLEQVAIAGALNAGPVARDRPRRRCWPRG